MRFGTLILMALFAFGMPEVRTGGSLEESQEMVTSYAVSQRSVEKLPRPVSPSVVPATPAAPGVPYSSYSTAPAAKSLFLKLRVLRL